MSINHRHHSRIKTYQLETVFEAFNSGVTKSEVTKKSSQNFDRTTFSLDGVDFSLDSDNKAKYELFMDNQVCNFCGLEMSHAVLTKNEHDKRYFNFFGVKCIDERHRIMKEVLFTIDHKIAQSMGGSRTAKHNLQVLCETCNNKKSCQEQIEAQQYHEEVKAMGISKKQVKEAILFCFLYTGNKVSERISTRYLYGVFKDSRLKLAFNVMTEVLGEGGL